jgi:hypothetical protein
MTLEFSVQSFLKNIHIKFHENPFSGSRVVLCGRTDMTELIAALRNFASPPKKIFPDKICREDQKTFYTQ